MFCTISSLEQRGDVVLAIDGVVLREAVRGQPLVHHVLVEAVDLFGDLAPSALDIGGAADILAAAEEDGAEEVVGDGEGDDDAQVAHDDLAARRQHG